jgi:hypothetical protein
LAHALGAPEKVAARAEAMLYRSGLLLLWAGFEVFLRDTLQELFRRHPHKIASGARGRRLSLTYEEIVELSGGLSSVEELRTRLVEREIERYNGPHDLDHPSSNFYPR